jgi:hypothetical protein
MEGAMQTRTTHAGGFLLMLGILAGIAGGVAAGQHVLGAIIGTGDGILAALLVWLIDRRRA